MRKVLMFSLMLFVLAIGILVAAENVSALVLHMDLKDLVSQSDYICIGKAVDKHIIVKEKDPIPIYTVFKFSVEKVKNEYWQKTAICNVYYYLFGSGIAVAGVHSGSV